MEEAEAVPGDALGIVLSVCLIGVCGLVALSVASIGRKCNETGCSNGSLQGRTARIHPEIARKIVHIGVSNWFFIYYYVFEDSFWAVVGLCVFALANAVLNACGMMGVLFSQTSRRRNWGMVYYPLSIVALVILADNGFGDGIGVGCALIGMGYGDGLAAIIGMKFGRHPLSNSLLPRRSGDSCKDASLDGGARTHCKTLEGSAVMFVVVLVSFVSIQSGMGGVGFVKALAFGVVAALVAMFAEAYTPSGLDNVSVPVLIYIVSVLCRI